MKNTFSLNFLQNMRKKLNMHETLFKTVDLRGPKSASIIYIYMVLSARKLVFCYS